MLKHLIGQKQILEIDQSEVLFEQGVHLWAQGMFSEFIYEHRECFWSFIVSDQLQFSLSVYM